jgi:hypothetical protein
VTLAALPDAGTGAAAELRRGSASVRVSLAPGAPITSFVSADCDWCAAGAWRDYAPSARACALPTFVAGAAGARFVDGGSVGSDQPEVEVRADGEANAVTARWPVPSYPLAWMRTIAFDQSGALRLGYRVTNEGRAPLPFVWGLSMPCVWGASVSVDLPRGARARVAASHGDGMLTTGSEFAWPSLRDGGHLVDLSRPAQLGSRRAVLCYVELPRGRLVVRSPAAALEVRADPGVLTHARVWVNNGAPGEAASRRGWWRRASSPSILAVGPTIGAPDHLSDAVGSWGAARWIESHETLSWDIVVRTLATGE